MWYQVSICRSAATRPLEVRNFLWHGCIFLNVQTVPIMLGLPKTLNSVSQNIKQAKAQNIQQSDYR